MGFVFMTNARVWADGDDADGSVFSGIRPTNRQVDVEI